MASEVDLEGQHEKKHGQSLIVTIPERQLGSLLEESPALRSLVRSQVKITSLTTFHPTASEFADRFSRLSVIARRKVAALIETAPKPVVFRSTNLRDHVAATLRIAGADLECAYLPNGLATLVFSTPVPQDLRRLATGGWLEIFAASAAVRASPAVSDAQVGVSFKIDLGRRIHVSEFDAVVLRSERLVIVEAKSSLNLLEGGRRHLLNAADNFIALEPWRNGTAFKHKPRFCLLVPPSSLETVNAIRETITLRVDRTPAAIRTTDDYADYFKAKPKSRVATAAPAVAQQLS